MKPIIRSAAADWGIDMWRIWLPALLGMMPQIAHAAWFEARSDHFTIYSDDKPENIRKLATQLEQFDSALHLLMHVPALPPSLSSRVTIYVVDDVDDIRKLAGGGSVAGFMENRASGSVAFVPRRGDGFGRWTLSSQTVLLHEYAHHFMYQSWPNSVLPLWYSEGFAEFCGNVEFTDDGKLILGMPPVYRAWSLGKAGATALPARKLLKLNPGRMNAEQMGALYARGWLLMHYLMMDKTRAGQLDRYIAAINDGTGADQASAAFGDPARLDREMTDYIMQRRLNGFVIPTDRLKVGAVAIRPLTAGEAATMAVRIRSTRGVDAKGAAAAITRARTAAAPYPDDAGAQNVLAEAEYDAGNFAEAEAAADRALKSDPKSIHAMLYKGMAMQALARKDGTDDAERWKAVRGWYLAANKIDTEYAWPLILYYQSFGAAGRPATENAIAGLLYAHALAPFDGSLRIMAARLLIDKDRLPEARRAFAPIAYRAEQDETARSWAQSVLEALDAKDAKNAMLRIESPPKADAADAPRKQ